MHMDDLVSDAEDDIASCEEISSEETEDVKICFICGDIGEEKKLAVCSRCNDGAVHTFLLWKEEMGKRMENMDAMWPANSRWGYGGYGRLGHREQKDEWKPRLVEIFQRHNVLPPNAIVSAGSASSACTAGGGQMYMWGKMKNTGDDWMYPKPLMDLSGWNVRCMASGNMHHIVGADDSCISWGAAQFGELGYGPNGQKSSANPKKVDSLNGMHVTSVGCGFGLSLIVVDRAKAGAKLDELDIYDGDTSTQVEEKVEVKATKKAPASAKSNKRKKTKDLSESEEEDDNESSDDENGDVKGAKGGRGGKASTRGRGRGAKKATPEPKPSGRGRGRPKKTESPPAKAESSGRGGKRGRGRPRKA